MLVLCAGMLRSGSTLQYNLARGIVAACGAGAGEGFMNGADMIGATDRLVAWARDGAIHVLKSHELPPEVDAALAGERVLLCYSYRDPVAVAASAKAIFGQHGSDLVSAMERAENVYRSVIDRPDTLAQSYETLTGDTRRAVDELARHLDLDPGPDARAAIVDDNSLESADRRSRELAARPSMRLRAMVFALNRRFGLSRMARRLHVGPGVLGALRRRLAPQDRTSLLHPGHVRRESPGETLTAEERDRIVERFARLRADMGYAPD